MHIIHLATELAPIAKVGGLGDVLYGLSKAVAKQGHKVEILLPKYDCIDYSQIKQLKVHRKEVTVKEGEKKYRNTIWSGELDGLQIFLVEAHGHPQDYFCQGKIYGCPNDIERFTYFCKVAVEYLRQSGVQPDILHLHDWPTALASLLYPKGKTVFTIHNLEHQGICAKEQIARLGITPDEKMEDPPRPHLVNLMRAAIECAGAVTTVSPTYEKEIQTPEEGMGLEKILAKHKKKLKGILNGIDEEYWDPEKDPLLVKRYATHKVDTPEKLKSVLLAKAENRKHVRTHFSLPQENVPLVVSITRLVTQKGPELILHAMQRTKEKGGQFILLGSNHDSKHGSGMEKEFIALQKSGSKNLALCLDKNEALAHLLFAAADMLVVPSRFEPCGLTQLIALRYGTVPIVRRTGGLADTIADIDTASTPPTQRNGFTFDHYNPEGLEWGLDRALTLWTHHPDQWHQLMLQGMQQNFTWERPATQYLSLYSQLLKYAYCPRKGISLG